MKAIRLSAKIVKTLVRDRMYYPDRLLMDTFIIISRCGVLLLLYWYVFRLNGGTINGTTFIIVAWSMFFYFAFSTLKLREIAREIMQDVQSGNVEVLFSKPISYIFYRMWWQIGSGLYSFTVISLLGSIALYYLVGVPFTIFLGIFLPTFIATIFLGITLSLLIYIVVGLFAFWMEDINPIFWMVDKTVMILGGSYLPVALFPDFMYKLAIYSPFGASQFITHTVYENWQSASVEKIEIQIVWIIIMAVVTFFLFKKAKQKISVNGG